MIDKARDGKAKLANNTYAIRKTGSKIAIVLHYTPIVIVSPDGTYQLFTGGHETPTTRSRLVGYTSAVIFSKDFSFQILIDPSLGKTKENTVVFYDGMKVDRFGRLLSPSGSLMKPAPVSTTKRSSTSRRS
jgi:hypothetical protein